MPWIIIYSTETCSITSTTDQYFMSRNTYNVIPTFIGGLLYERVLDEHIILRSILLNSVISTNTNNINNVPKTMRFIIQ